MSAGLGTSVALAVAGTPVKANKTHNRFSWGFDAVSNIAQFAPVSPAAGQARTAIAARVFVAQAFKLGKVGVACTQLDSLVGNSFNIVVGNGTPAGSGVAGNTVSPDAQKRDGYPTVFAQPGQLIFDNDVAFNATNFPATSWGPAMTAGAGGSNTFAPLQWDGCYLPGWYSLRVTTNATTGLINNLTVVMLGAFIDTNCSYNEGGEPTVDW